MFKIYKKNEDCFVYVVSYDSLEDGESYVESIILEGEVFVIEQDMPTGCRTVKIFGVK